MNSTTITTRRKGKA